MTTNTEFFFESRYYDNGEKIFSFEKRPSWAPDQNWVGIKQPDKIAIKQGDLVLEMVRFKKGGSTVNWVGLYGKSIDKHAGDRGSTSHGLGIWIKDAVVRNSEYLGELLYALLMYQHKSGDLNAVAMDANSNQDKIILLPNMDAGDQFANNEITAKFATGSLHDSLIWFSQVDAYGPESSHLLPDHIGSFITLFQLMNDRFSKNERLLLVISRDESTKYVGSKFHQELPSSEFSAFTELSGMICVPSKSAAKNIDILKAQVSRLETENSKMRSEAESLKRQNGNGGMKFGKNISSDIALSNIQNELKEINKRLFKNSKIVQVDNFYLKVNFALLTLFVLASAGISIWQHQ